MPFEDTFEGPHGGDLGGGGGEGSMLLKVLWLGQAVSPPLTPS